MFADRVDAGRRLAQELLRFKQQHPVVLALPRGGVPVGAEIVKQLDAPLDLILVRKIGVPFQPELAAGAVVDGQEPITVWNRDVLQMLGMTEEDFAEVVQAKLREIDERRQRYLAGRPRVDVAGRTAVVVDDGIATGATVKAALRALRRRGPKRIVLAVPVAPAETVAELRGEADEVICLDTPADFGAIGFFYMDFSQTSDDEVTALLRAAKPSASKEDNKAASAG